MKVTAGIFVKDDHILLMRCAPGQSAAGGWEYPGGKIEPGESGEQCLRRELNEELCIDAEIGEKMAESIFETGSKTIHLHAYARLCHGCAWRRENLLGSTVCL